MITKTLIFLALFSSLAFASQIFYEPLDTVLKKTRYALLVEIQSITPVQEDRFGKTIEFTATPLKCIFGEMGTNGEVSFMYFEGKVHERGKTMVSPLVSGSGLEFKFKKGDKVILLISGNSGVSKSLNVLRIEPEENMSNIISIIERTKKTEQSFPADCKENILSCQERQI